MSTKQEIMSRMLELQKQFIELEKNGDFNAKDYFNPPAGHFMRQYRDEYDDLARQLVKMAHAEKGSKM